MSFKDTWRPRIDGVDDADSSAVNEIAEAVINNENFINNAPNKYYNKESVNNLFANAFKGSASGEAVALKDVSPLEHNLGVRVESKNLIPYPYYDTTKTENGVTFTDNGNGSVTLNGTPTADTSFYLRLCSNADEYISLDKDAFLSGCPKGAYGNGFFMECAIISQASGASTWVGDYGNGYNVQPDMLLSHLYIGVRAGFTFDNVTIYPQLEYGTKATLWRPYVANPKAVKLLVQGEDGNPVEYTVNADGTVEGVKSIYPTTTIMTDTAGAIMTVEYNKDANKVVKSLEDRISALEAMIVSQ